MTPEERLCALCVAVAARDTLRRLTFSKPRGDSPLRVTARVTNARGRMLLAFEHTMRDGKVKHTAALREEWEETLSALISAYGQVNLSSGAGDAELRISKKGKATLSGAAPIEARLAGEKTAFEKFSDSLNRQKNYLLSGKEDFLIALGISDKTGRVHDKRQGKYRQINRFLEHVADVYEHLPSEGPLCVYDLCCGKSYLSFAVYYYLRYLRAREVSMLCMDLKEDVMRDCAGIARAVGFDGMQFVAGDIRRLPEDKQPDMVVSLHACDIATDIVLKTAVDRGARVILSTPCCHRTLSRHITMPALSFVTEHPHLCGKLGDVLTDALRCAYLRAHGYAVTAPELTDPDDTPKNTLLRATRRAGFSPDSREGKRLAEEYDACLTMLLGDNKQAYLKETMQL